VKAAGEPDLDAASFPLDGTPWPAAFSYGDGRWARAFDRTSAFDDALLLGEGAAQEDPPAPMPAVAASVPEAAAAAALCGEAARARSATLDRFDQWDAQLRGSSRSSLDRGSWTLNAAAWVGHCQELNALRAALEQQLGCAVELHGLCAGGEEAR